MRRNVIVLATLLLSISTCALATSRNVKEPASSSGILVVSAFGFEMQGDGITTTLRIVPWDIPQIDFGPPLPHLPIVGVYSTGTCSQGSTFTASPIQSGRKLLITFSAAPPQGLVQTCSVLLLFQPQY